MRGFSGREERMPARELEVELEAAEVLEAEAEAAAALLVSVVNLEVEEAVVVEEEVAAELRGVRRRREEAVVLEAEGSVTLVLRLVLHMWWCEGHMGKRDM